MGSSIEREDALGILEYIISEIDTENKSIKHFDVKFKPEDNEFKLGLSWEGF